MLLYSWFFVRSSAFLAYGAGAKRGRGEGGEGVLRTQNARHERKWTKILLFVLANPCFTPLLATAAQVTSFVAANISKLVLAVHKLNLFPAEMLSTVIGETFVVS